MTPAELVQCFVREKNGLLRAYMDQRDTAVALAVARLNLLPDKVAVLETIVDGVLTDAFYTTLLALDGEASLGGVQQMYSLRDEAGNELANGQLEGPAWEHFHGPEAAGSPSSQAGEGPAGKPPGRRTRG
jgi:hypothetical protein